MRQKFTLLITGLITLMLFALLAPATPAQAASNTAPLACNPCDCANDNRENCQGIEFYAMTPGPDAVPIGSVTPGDRIAIMIGSERSGLSDELLALATPVRIPMAAGVDSLNAAAATAVACFALGPHLP